jgi:hypothetical protein
MPAGTGTINLSQVINFLSVAGNALGVASGIPVNFLPGLATQLTAGSGAKQYNNAFAVGPVTTSGTTPIVYNLTNTLVEPSGEIATFADITLLCITCPSSNTDFIKLGAGTDPVVEFTNAWDIFPGMTLVLFISTATGLAVTTTTADRLTVTSNSGNQTFQLLLAGH